LALAQNQGIGRQQQFMISDGDGPCFLEGKMLGYLVRFPRGIHRFIHRYHSQGKGQADSLQ